MEGYETKRIEYSYPTSPNAERYGYGRIGCYTIAIIHTPMAIPVTVDAYPTYEEAKACADKLAMPYNKYTR
jgi:hypothetical protein